MTVGDIKKVISEMITDIKLKRSFADTDYEWAAKNGEIEKAFNADKKVREMDNLRYQLACVDIDKFDVDTFMRVEEYLILLRKDDNFSVDEIEAFISITNE